MADWDTNNPDDNDIVSQYPSNERAARAAVVTNFGVDHHETDDADVGKHEVIQILDNAGDATIAAGQIGIWNDGGALKTRTGTGSVKTLASTGDIPEAFPSGTKMVFYQASAPTGWTQDTTVNDQVLKVVNGAGGGAGGTWAISGLTVQNHTLSISELPSHNHGGGTGNTAPGTNNSGFHGHTGSAASNGAHNHRMFVNDTSGFNYFDSSTFGSPAALRGVNNNDPDEYEITRVTSGTPSIAPTQTAGAHTHSLSINGNGSHSHTVDNHSHSIPSQGGGSGHNHGISHNGTWRPAHINVIVATKD